MRRTLTITIMVCVLGGLGLAGFLFWRGNRNRSSQPITIGFQESPAMALVMVANDEGFFKGEGLNVQLRSFTAGKFALQALLGKSLTFAVSGDVPTTLAEMQGNRISVITQVVKSTTNEVRVVVKKDAGLADAHTYFMQKRRTLATSFGGGPEFFFYQFLAANAIPVNQVNIVSQNPQDMPSSLEGGGIDGVAVFDPFAYFTERDLRDKAQTFELQNGYSELYVLVANPGVISSRGSDVEKLLKALDRAAQFIKAHPVESQSIVARYTQLDPDVVKAVWPDFDFTPGITQQLFNYQEKEAIWAKQRGYADASSQIPDFRSFVYSGKESSSHQLEVPPQ